MHGRLVPLMICCVSGGLLSGHAQTLEAAENLAPLQVDPALLDPSAPPPQPPQQPPQVRPVTAPPEPEARPIAPRAPAAEPTRPAAQESEQAPPATGAVRPTAPAVAPDVAPATTPAAAPAPESTPAPAPAAEPTPRPAEDAAPTVPPAESAPLPGLRLSPRLRPLRGRSDEPRPTFLAADRIDANGPNETAAQGNVDLRRIGNTVSADRLTYWQDEDEVEAEGNVILTQDLDRISGPKLRLKLEKSIGYFETPTYSITRLPPPGQTRESTTAYGQAERIDFEGENLFRLTRATYSTCGPENPDWYARGRDVFLDYTREVGEARDATVVFKGVPFLYSPWLEFSLNNQRKSGFLTPTFGTTSQTGVSLTLPYYWNIAPDMDATIAPRYMSRRGLQVGGEFRYLEHGYSGIARGEYLPNDQVFGADRYAYSLQHAQALPFGLSAGLDVNGVSDDTYFTDLASRATITSQTNLLRQGNLNYSGGWWNAMALLQRYQTLQDPARPPVLKPYEKLPQLQITANRPDLKGFAVSAIGDYTDFSHPTLDTGRRLVVYPQVAYPMETSSFFVTPKLGVHFRNYDLTRQLSTGPDSISVTLPIASVDSGLTFERQTDWFGANTTQTLEPRLYYLYVPYQDQSQIPLFDTAQADYNFAQIFSENRFSGNDRIGDANQITAAVVSRLLDGNGVELMRGAIGQRYYFRDQTVTLAPGIPAQTSRSADILATLAGRVGRALSFDTAVQYNPNEETTERFVFGGRYQPGPARVLSASYRFQKNVLEDVDVSGQWPLFGGWYGVGRYSYSLRDRRLLAALGGLEYNGGCWVARVVVERFATTLDTVNNTFFVQLELNGLSSIGSNPLDILNRNIPGYGRINQPVADPVFGAD